MFRTFGTLEHSGSSKLIQGTVSDLLNDRGACYLNQWGGSVCLQFAQEKWSPPSICRRLKGNVCCLWGWLAVWLGGTVCMFTRQLGHTYTSDPGSLLVSHGWKEGGGDYDGCGGGWKITAADEEWEGTQCLWIYPVERTSIPFKIMWP